MWSSITFTMFLLAYLFNFQKKYCMAFLMYKFNGKDRFVFYSELILLLMI